MERGKIIESTLGDLVVALTEETAPFVRDKREVYKVVAFALVHLLSNSGSTSKLSQVWQ